MFHVKYDVIKDKVTVHSLSYNQRIIERFLTMYYCFHVSWILWHQMEEIKILNTKSLAISSTSFEVNPLCSIARLIISIDIIEYNETQYRNKYLKQFKT